MRPLLLSAVITLGVTTPNAGAQDNPAGRGLIAAGLGLAVAQMSVGAETGAAFGPTAHVRLGIATGRRTLLVLDAEVQPFKVENPLGFEDFRSVYVLVALQQYLAQRVYLRAGAGLQFRSWSGANPVTSSDAGLAFGFAMGAELPVGTRLVVAPEFVLDRAFIEAEGSVSASLIGLRLGLALHR